MKDPTSGDNSVTTVRSLMQIIKYLLAESEHDVVTIAERQLARMDDEFTIKVEAHGEGANASFDLSLQKNPTSFGEKLRHRYVIPVDDLQNDPNIGLLLQLRPPTVQN